MPRVRLYESALNDVKYVAGRPLRFSTDPREIAEREARKLATEIATRDLRYD